LSYEYGMRKMAKKLVVKKSIMQKAKYLKRTGSPGHYQYIYKYPEAGKKAEQSKELQGHNKKVSKEDAFKEKFAKYDKHELNALQTLKDYRVLDDVKPYLLEKTPMEIRNVFDDINFARQQKDVGKMVSLLEGKDKGLAKIFFENDTRQKVEGNIKDVLKKVFPKSRVDKWYRENK